MIFNYLPYIFGVPFLLFGTYLFLLYSGIYKPKFRTAERGIKFEKSKQKIGKKMIAGAVFLILSGAYDLIIHNSDSYRFSNRKETISWTENDRETLITTCMRDAGPNAIKYPKITKDYCECSMNKLMKAMSKEQYENTLTKTQEEQIKEDVPIIKDCIAELRNCIDSADSKMRL